MALLLAEECEPLCAGLDFCAVAWAAFSWASDQGGELTEMARRSWVARPLFKSILANMAEDEFIECTAEVRQLLATCFMFASTKCVEDAFQRIRSTMVRAQSNNEMTTARMYHTLLQRRILEEVHHFDTIDFTHVSMKRYYEGCPSRKALRTWFRPLTTKPALGLKLVSTRSKADWLTWSADSQVRQYVELHFMILCHRCSREGDPLPNPSRLWLSVLFIPGMVVRRKGTAEWQLCCGPVQGMAMLLYPLNSDGVFLQMVHAPECKVGKYTHMWDYCDDLSAWEAQPVRWVSPLSSLQAGAASGSRSENFAHSCRARMQGPPMKIVEAAANAGFRGLSVSELEKVAKEFGWALPATETELDVVRGCLGKALDSNDDDEIMRLCHLRIEKSLVDDEFVDRGDVWDCVDETDMKEIEAHKDHVQKRKSYKRTYAEWRSVRATKGGAAKPPAPASGAASSGEGPRAPPRKAIANLNLAEYKPFMPPGWQLKVSRWDNRYRTEHKHYKGTGRSWVARDEWTALMEVMHHAWSAHSADFKKDKPVAWLQAEFAALGLS